MSPPGFDALRQNASRTRDTLVGQVGVVSQVPDEILKSILSEADQFDARRPLWMGLRRSDETQLNIKSSPGNEEWVWKYIQSLPLEDQEYRRTLSAVEINDMWWKAFSPMAQGQAPSAKGLLSMLLLSCSGLGSVVHTGAAPIEINHLKVVSYLDLSSREALECDFPHGAVHGDVRMGFSTRNYLRMHLNKKRLLVNVVEAKGENGELYYPTFLLDTNTWSLYIYFAVGPGSVRNEILKLVAVAVRQMLAWAGFRPTINYFAPPITTVYAGDVFGHAMIDVFMIFLTLRGWVGLDYKSVMRGRPTEPGINTDLEKSFIVPQRDWTLGEFWGSSRTGGKQPIGPYKGWNLGVPNIIAFLGTVICDHMGLKLRKYKNGRNTCCIDDWTDPKTVYNPRPIISMSPYGRTNLGHKQFLTWDDVKVEFVSSDGLDDEWDEDEDELLWMDLY